MNRRQFLGQAAGTAMAAVLPSKASAGEGDSFCFAVVADPHCSDGITEGLEAYGSGVDRFLNTIKTMEAMSEREKPSFILLAGDVHPEALRPRMVEATIPVHATPGNHESTREKRALLRSLFPGDFTLNRKPADYYSFVHKGARFIAVCDAGAGGDHVGHLCSEIIEPPGQCEWLEGELRKPEPVKIVFAHIPAEREGRDRDMYLNRNDSRWFNALVKETQPVAVFFGHLHRPTSSYRTGRSQIFHVRSCCWNFDKAPVGFLHCRVKEGKLETREIITGEYK
ncbi:MAG TPA: metallophosphoesterase [Candidatus Hydrogenedentes bacterium]|nr:metallophosphoesterase [Candidatus Hydrogenedentota bacterium]